MSQKQPILPLIFQIQATIFRKTDRLDALPASQTIQTYIFVLRSENEACPVPASFPKSGSMSRSHLTNQVAIEINLAP